MSLKDVYQQFLADPKSASLAPDVSLIYVTTTTRFDQSDAVLGHLSKQQKIVKTKAEQILSACEGPDSLCLDVELTLEFVSGGGSYLPAMDDNFLADRVVTFPTVHVVRFNAQKQIQQVRLYWDQASLLKQVEVIGARGRAWPIRDAKDQTRLIKAAVSDVAETPVSASSQPSSAKDGATESEDVTSPGRKVVKDPYAAESLYELLSPGTDREQKTRPLKTQHPLRAYDEVFISHEEDDSPDRTPSRKIVPRASAAKNFQPSRLFDEEESDNGRGLYKTHPEKYNHFEIGGDNSAREIKTKATRAKSRHQSQWDFEDFVTPEKPKRQVQPQLVRHFAWSDDEVEETPAPKPRVVQPRRDAETHFKLTENDDGEPRARRIISSFQDRGLSLYHDPLLPGENSPAAAGQENKAPLSDAPNKAPPRKKDLDPHWTLTDTTPVKEKQQNLENSKPVATHRLKAVQMMEPHWDTYDVSPQPKKVAPPPSRGVRNVMQRSWSFGSEDEEERM